MLKFGLLGERSMTESIPLCFFFYSGMPLLFGIIVMKNEDAANQTLHMSYCLVGKNLKVLFCVHNSIDFDKLSTATGRKSPILQMAVDVDTRCCASLSTSSVHIDFNQISNLDS